MPSCDVGFTPGSRLEAALEALRGRGLGRCLLTAALIIVAVSACSDEDRPTPPDEPVTSFAELDLRSFDWDNASVDTSFCGGQGSETLEGGKGFVYTTEFPPHWIVDISLAEPIVYGDLTGDQRDEALVPLWCTNGGGTAAGQLAYGIEVFTSADGDVEYLGTIEPEPPQSPQHTSYIDDAKTTVEKGRVVVEEVFYEPKDSTCCPTGRRTSTWMVQDGRVVKTSSN